jgi:hypothetical protein
MSLSIDHLDAEQLGLLAGKIVLAVGMTPGVAVTVPEAVEGVSWKSCYERGMERLARPVNLS